MIQIRILTKVENQEIGKSICAALDPDNFVGPPMTLSMKCTGETVKIKLNNILKIETALATINDLLSAWIVSEEGIMKINRRIRK
jgi:hypothetical protein